MSKKAVPVTNPALLNQRLQTILHHLPCGVTFVSKDGRVLYENAQTERLLGYTVADVPTVAVSHQKFYPDPEYRRWVRQKWAVNVAKGSTPSDEVFKVTCKNGDTKFISWGLTVLEDGVGVLTLTDVTAQKQNEEFIRQLAYHDYLTGLPNMRLFEERLAQDLARAQRNNVMLGVLFMDLDGFKDVNDNCGHQVGDKLLGVVGQRLKEVVRESDTIARLGGDEFCVSLPDIADAEDIVDIAVRIQESLRPPATIDGHDMTVGASIGISVYPWDGDTLEVLVRKADDAMYAAKKSGGFRYRLCSDQREVCG